MQPPWFTLPDQNADTAAPVVVIGAGLAGCNTAFEFAQRGIDVLLIDAAEHIASGASGNHAGIVKPFVTRKPSHTDDFYQHAVAQLLELFNTHEDLKTASEFNQCGVLQLLEKPYPESPFYTPCTPSEASTIAGSKIDSHAIFFENGGWLNPSSLCTALVEHPSLKEKVTVKLNTRVENIRATDNGWSLSIASNARQSTRGQSNSYQSDHAQSKHGKHDINCQTLILANGHSMNQFDQTKALPITPARGQCSEFQLANNAALKTVVSGKRYAIPNATANSVIVGASFDRGDTNTAINPNDHANNRAALAPLLPDIGIDETDPSGFCAVRATTPDRFPVVGPVPDFAFYKEAYSLLKNGLPENRFEPAQYQTGLYVIGGFGSRGIVSARYCAKLLVDHLCSDSSLEPSLANWLQLLHPARFCIRQLKRA